VAETKKAKRPPAVGGAVQAKSEADQIMALVDRANQGDTTVLPALRKVFDEHPELWGENGDLARIVETAWLKRMGGKDELFKESVSRHLRALRKELRGPTPSPLERLLVDRIGVCWLALHYAEAIYAQTVGDLTLKQGEHYQDRIDRSQKRYLAAIKALAQIRRLQVPMLQVNVAEQQVNVAQGAIP
jgi:hypothetical protein